MQRSRWEGLATLAAMPSVKSNTPIQRIKEALAEIKALAKKEPVRAADGAVLFLEKLVPGIEQVDSSSGGIGSAVNRAIETLVPIIAKADEVALLKLFSFSAVVNQILKADITA